MTRIKTICAALLAVLGYAMTLHAQTEEKALSYPQLFFGAQGGGQATLSDYKFSSLITPTASLSFGAHFTPVIAARLHVGGVWNKGGFANAAEDFQYRYKHLTSDIDLMVNLVTLFGRKNYYPVNLYLIGGGGLTCAWDNDEAFSRSDRANDILSLAYGQNMLSHNARLGLQLDCNLSRHVSLNLEVAANNLKDRYNSRYDKRVDWQMTAQLGVAYKFAAKKTKKKVAEEEVWETRLDTIWYDEPSIATRIENGTATWNVHYRIRESDFEADAQLAAIGAFLKEHRDCKVDIKSYADAGTGNPKLNMEYSKARCEKAVKALTDAGVPASSITANYYGDTVQPFAENDKNRVSIIVASGLKDVETRKSEKKFRTKVVRYRIQ